MKEFIFDFEITGRAEITIKAKDFKEACELFEAGEGVSKVLEWDFDFPYNMTYDEENMKNYLSE